MISVIVVFPLIFSSVSWKIFFLFHIYHYKSQCSQVIILPLYPLKNSVSLLFCCCFHRDFCTTPTFVSLQYWASGSPWFSQALCCSPDLLYGVIAWLQDFLQVGYHLKLISWQLSNFSACFNHIFQMSLIGAKKGWVPWLDKMNLFRM